MSNVLPTGDKLRLWSFYRARFILVASVAFGVAAIIALVTSAPTYVMLAINQPITEALINTQADKGSERANAFEVQAQIAQFLPFASATTTPMEAIEGALEGKPEGLTIEHISYTSDASQRQILLFGNAKNREQINQFRKTLEAKGTYKSVALPVSDLVGASGNQFTITLTSTL